MTNCHKPEIHSHNINYCIHCKEQQKQGLYKNCLWTPALVSLAAVDTADNQPNEDPPRAEECDDTVEKMVMTIITHVHRRMHLGTQGW